MEKVKVTYERFMTFVSAASQYNPDPVNKLKYSIDRVIKKNKHVISDYDEKSTEINIENAATDNNGVLLIDSMTKQYQYTKEGMKKRMVALKKLDQEQCEVEPYYATIIPEKLGPRYKEVFKTFVLDPEQYPEDEPEPEE